MSIDFNRINPSPTPSNAPSADTATETSSTTEDQSVFEEEEETSGWIAMNERRQEIIEGIQELELEALEKARNDRETADEIEDSDEPADETPTDEIEATDEPEDSSKNVFDSIKDFFKGIFGTSKQEESE